jgi:glycerol-3-phosphate acyltransferase PlsY
MLLQVVLLTIGGYLLGSVPTSYIAGRLLRGIDIRDYGSGTVSGSNVWHSVARWAVVPVGIFDVLKGFTPVAIAWALGFSPLLVGIVGLAAIAGHNWPIFLNFSGGRGVATMMGVLVVLAPWELLVFIAVWLLCIAVLRNVPLGVIIGASAMPVASFSLGEPPELTLCLLALLLLLVIKRLTANRGALIGDWRRVMLCRLLLDRDIPDREAWIHRTLSDRQEPPQ